MHGQSDESLSSLSSEAVHQIAERMQLRLGNHVRNLEIFPHAAGLILVGNADTYYAKQLAQHVAMEISGRTVLANQIEVSGSRRAPRSI